MHDMSAPEKLPGVSVVIHYFRQANNAVLVQWIKYALVSLSITRIKTTFTCVTMKASF